MKERKINERKNGEQEAGGVEEGKKDFRAANKNSFHCRSLCQLFSQLFNESFWCVKIEKNSERCLSQFVRGQGDVFKCLDFSN